MTQRKKKNLGWTALIALGAVILTLNNQAKITEMLSKTPLSNLIK